MKILLGVALSLFFSAVPAFADSGQCIKKGVVLVEITREVSSGQVETIISGRVVRQGNELSAIRQSCGEYMVVLLSPKSTMGDLMNFGFFAAKSGFYESSDKFLPFAYTTDKTRMTYLKSMAVVKFSSNPDELERLAKAPPTKSNFL